MLDIIKRNPEYGAFGARTNRVGYAWQLVGNIDVDNHDISYHRKIGRYLQKKYYSQLSPGATCEILNAEPSRYSGDMINQLRFSGTLILVKKSTWKKIMGFKTTGFLGVDDDFRERLFKKKVKFAIMDGVYLYHWYRADDPYMTSTLMLNKLRSEFKRYAKSKKNNLNDIKLLN